MLDREILKLNYGVSYGSVTLSSLQNDAVPEIDLLVREAIQNSSDAAIGLEGPSYRVGFQTGTFAPIAFNAYLTDIEDHLNARYPLSTAEYIEIRDTCTSGLTGEIRKSEIKKDDHGNFFKLIYDTGKKQTQVTAGGNHGLGKSVYYRVGIGIVIFYSRIQKEYGFESRLIITLVEDENKKNPDGTDATILNHIEPSSAGKAWWGLREGEDLLPLTDEEFIIPLLEVFGLAPFKGTETGTSVIIPYINSADLLNQIIPPEAEIKDDVKDHLKTVWLSNLADYLKLSIQRWYAPKIHNREINKFSDKKWLLVTVNKVPIQKQSLLPVFNLAQELYTTALAKVHGKDYVSPVYPQIECLPVNIQKYFEGSMTSGYVAVVKISRSELNGNQNLLSPYDYFGHYEADGGLNEPVVMYTRDLGMVIDYSLTGPWVKGLTTPESPEEFIFAFYVPNTAKKLKSDLTVAEYAGVSFGQYLRDCEASDHMEWNDPVKMQIVSRIQKNVVNQINNKINKAAATPVNATASKLSNRLGKNLLPRVGYGKRTSGGNGGSGGGGGGKVSNILFEITSQAVRGNLLTIDFSLKMLHSCKSAKVSIIVASEGGWIDPESWQEEIGTPFPAVIRECCALSMTSGVIVEPRPIELICDADNPVVGMEEFDLSMQYVEGSLSAATIKIDSKVFNLGLTGRLVVNAVDKKYRFNFKVE
ncbi:MAG: hypothetical protein PUG70_04670 [Lachnospiraceae bacterium]|nr:hypothetical protein [Lachnospiraceae bacterium]